MRYISLCASSEDVTSEVASILAKFVGNSPNTATRKYTIGFCIINHELCHLRLLYNFYFCCIFLFLTVMSYYTTTNKEIGIYNQKAKSRSCPDLRQLEASFSANQLQQIAAGK